MGYIVVPCFIAVFYGPRYKPTKYNKEHLLFLMQKLEYPDGTIHSTKKVATAMLLYDFFYSYNSTKYKQKSRENAWS